MGKEGERALESRDGMKALVINQRVEEIIRFLGNLTLMGTHVHLKIENTRGKWRQGHGTRGLGCPTAIGLVPTNPGLGRHYQACQAPGNSSGFVLVLTTHPSKHHIHAPLLLCLRVKEAPSNRRPVSSSNQILLLVTSKMLCARGPRNTPRPRHEWLGRVEMSLAPTTWRSGFHVVGHG